MNKRLLILGTLLIAILHTGVLVKFITDRAAALRAGQEVVLETGFIDPRDLFRGHYTILNFMIEQLDTDDVTVDGDFESSDTVYLVLDTTAEFAQVKHLTDTQPDAADGPFLKAKIRYFPTGNSSRISLLLPFERFYAAQDRALELQNMQRERKLGVILSVAEDGTAMIKGLTIEGEKIYEEPLY